MPATSKRSARFVRLVIAGGSAQRGANGLFRATHGGRVATLEASDVMALIRLAILAGDGQNCRATSAAAGWLTRQLAEFEPYAAQHRHEVTTADGRRLDLAESPLARLAAPAAGESAAFLAPHQVEAGERLRQLVERARLRPRLTMSYDAARVPGAGGASRAPEISDLAADARRRLAEISRALPRDCAEVVLDVCGLEKGLQLIETERGWPRRSAKLVLRIGLDQLARHFGLEAAAIGRAEGIHSHWMDEGARPEIVG